MIIYELTFNTIDKDIQVLFSLATKGCIANPTLTKIINRVDKYLFEKDISLNSYSGELWQQLQDFKEVEE